MGKEMNVLQMAFSLLRGGMTISQFLSERDETSDGESLPNADMVRFILKAGEAYAEYCKTKSKLHTLSEQPQPHSDDTVTMIEDLRTLLLYLSGPEGGAFASAFHVLYNAQYRRELMFGRTSNRSSRSTPGWAASKVGDLNASWRIKYLRVAALFLIGAPYAGETLQAYQASHCLDGTLLQCTEQDDFDRLRDIAR